MLDLIFPKICPFCESASEEGKICNTCLADIVLIDERFVCLRCGVPFRVAGLPNQSIYPFVGVDPKVCADNGQSLGGAPTVPAESTLQHFCGRCLQGEFLFDKARSVAFYDGLLRDMLHKFKYGGKLGLGVILSGMLCENYPPSLGKAELIIPVPLYIGKLRKREYNQSVILASRLKKNLGIPLDPFVLVKLWETRPQFEISSEDERRRNVRGAFSVVSPAKVRRKSILLIDDIFTTGSTVNECSRVLVEAGASGVQVLTLMRASQR